MNDALEGGLPRDTPQGAMPGAMPGVGADEKAPKHYVAPTPQALLSGLIEKAMDGTLARDRDPKPWEPAKLIPAHLQMIYDRAAGYQLKEIAERYDYTPVQVANVLGSPDAQTILSTIMSIQATGLIDMEARFTALAPEALNVQVGLMRDDTVHPAVRSKISSSILDRAGYAPRTKSTIDVNQRIFLPAQVATGMKAALEESKRVRTVDYSRFLQKVGDAQAVKEASLLDTPVGSDGQQTLDGASPVPSSTEEAA